MTRQVSRLSGGRLPLPVGETVLTCGLSVAGKVKHGLFVLGAGGVRTWWSPSRKPTRPGFTVWEIIFSTGSRWVGCDRRMMISYATADGTDTLSYRWLL